MIYVVKSLFNTDVTSGLYSGFLNAINESNYDKDIKLIDVPGAFDIPGAVSRILDHDNCKIIVTLGCVIKGETDHYHYICDAVANGIMNLTLKSTTPILFGVLTCQNKKLAQNRSGNDMKTNKGYELGVMSKNILFEEDKSDYFTKN